MTCSKQCTVSNTDYEFWKTFSFGFRFKVNNLKTDTAGFLRSPKKARLHSVKFPTPKEKSFLDEDCVMKEDSNVSTKISGMILVNGG